MNEAQVVTDFLERALLQSRRDRYIGFIRQQKTRRKFLQSLYHDLEWCIDQDQVVQRLPDDVLDRPSLCFAPPAEFGAPISTLRGAVDSAGDACLAITTDGRAGVYRPESPTDSALHFLWG
ncbi:MAG: hypothetical protein AAFR96_06680 [Planctomycetota bacterium]